MKPCGNWTLGNESAPETGFRIGSKLNRNLPSTSTWLSCAATLARIGTKNGPIDRVNVAAKTSNGAPGHDLLKGRPLGCRRGVNVDGSGTAALVDRGGPFCRQEGFATVDRKIAVGALLDDKAQCGLAVAGGRRRVEVAGAPPFAIAGEQIITPDVPFDIGHVVAPR